MRYAKYLLLAVSLAWACTNRPDAVDGGLRVVKPVGTIATLPDSVTVYLASPASVDVGPRGVVLADRTTKGVVVLDHGLSLVSRFGREGAGPGELQRPSDARWGPDGSVWVVDNSLGRATRFTVDGRYLGSVRTPSLSGVPVREDAFLVPGGPGTAWFTLLGDSIVTPFESSVPAFAHLPHGLPAASFIWVKIDKAENGGLVLLDNTSGDLWWVRDWTQNPPEPEPMELPNWFIERAREKQSERVAAVSHLQKGVVVPLFVDIQMTAPDRVWLYSGWSEAIGLSLALGGGGESILVVSSADREFAGMRKSVLLNDSTLLAVYETDVRLYRLGPAERPAWTQR